MHPRPADAPAPTPSAVPAGAPAVNAAAVAAVAGLPPSQLCDISVGGDPLAYPHLLPPVPAHPSTVAEFAGLARSLAGDPGVWRPLVRYDPISRWYERLLTGPGYEVWLLSWLPGQGSGRHDHGRSSGVMTVLSGTVTEHGAGGGGPVTRRLAAGAQRVFAPGYVHEVVNDALEPAVSLHVYFPGLTEMTVRPAGRAPALRTVPAP